MPSRKRDRKVKAPYINGAVIERVQGMKPAEINLVLDVFCAQAMANLLAGKEVKMHGLGKIVALPSGEFYNAHTGKREQSRAKYRFKFVPGFMLELMRLPNRENTKRLRRMFPDAFPDEPKVYTPPEIDAGTVLVPATEVVVPTKIVDADQYHVALAEVEKLVALDPSPESKDGKRLLLLAGLVQDYEKDHFLKSPAEQSHDGAA